MLVINFINNNNELTYALKLLSILGIFGKCFAINITVQPPYYICVSRSDGYVFYNDIITFKIIIFLYQYH